MSDRAVDLFERFLAEQDAGRRPDPAAFIDDAGDQGEELAGMLTAYLATHPQTDMSAEDVIAFAARPELDPIMAPAPWSVLLPALRARTRTTRGQLVTRLAEILGVRGSETQVGDYVHELEAGFLSPRRVRPAVVDALAEVFSVPKALFEAGRQFDAQAEPAPSALFARMADASNDAERLFDASPPRDPRVDDLFTGGADE